MPLLGTVRRPKRSLEWASTCLFVVLLSLSLSLFLFLSLSLVHEQKCMCNEMDKCVHLKEGEGESVCVRVCD